MKNTTAFNTSLSRLRILVIEDAEMARYMLALPIRQEHTVYTAATAREGWKLFLEHAPHIVFLDIGLPDCSGHELAHKMKKHNPEIYLIMETASHHVNDKKSALLNNVDGFITKPFSKKEILDYVERYKDIQRQASKTLA